MNKKFAIALISILIISVGIYFVIELTTRNKVTANNPNMQDNSNNNDNNGNDSLPSDSPSENGKINLFGKDLNTLSDISDDDIKNYTNEIAKIFVEKTYIKFSYNDIVAIVAYKLLVMNSATNNDIANYVETILGNENFQLKEGIYKAPNGKSEITIFKDDDNFTSNLKVMGPSMGSKINVYRAQEVEENYVIVHYDYGYDDLNNDKFVVIGKTGIYLKYVNDNLILEKIVYEKK